MFKDYHKQMSFDRGGNIVIGWRNKVGQFAAISYIIKSNGGIKHVSATKIQSKNHNH